MLRDEKAQKKKKKNERQTRALLLSPAIIPGVLCVCVARIRMHYCLTTMKRAGFRVPELAPPSCAPGRNKRATPSRRVEGPAGFDNKSLLSYRAARGGRSFRLSPPLGRGDLSKERQITSGDNIKPESFSPTPSRSAFTRHVCGGAATSSDSPTLRTARPPGFRGSPALPTLLTADFEPVGRVPSGPD